MKKSLILVITLLIASVLAACSANYHIHALNTEHGMEMAYNTKGTPLKWAEFDWMQYARRYSSAQHLIKQDPSSKYSGELKALMGPKITDKEWQEGKRPNREFWKPVRRTGLIKVCNGEFGCTWWYCVLRNANQPYWNERDKGSCGELDD